MLTVYDSTWWIFVLLYYSATCNVYGYVLQSSSIDFLASQGFDFNKVFKEGKNVVLIVTIYIYYNTFTCM